MIRLVIAALAAAATFAVTSVAASASPRLGTTLSNEGTTTCVNVNAEHANGADEVYVGVIISCTRP